MYLLCPKFQKCVLHIYPQFHGYVSRMFHGVVSFLKHHEAIATHLAPPYLHTLSAQDPRKKMPPRGHQSTRQKQKAKQCFRSDSNEGCAWLYYHACGVPHAMHITKPYPPGGMCCPYLVEGGRVAKSGVVGCMGHVDALPPMTVPSLAAS